MDVVCKSCSTVVFSDYSENPVLKVIFPCVSRLRGIIYMFIWHFYSQNQISSDLLKQCTLLQVLTVGQKATFEYHGTNYILTVNRADVEGQNQSNGIERGMLSQDTYVVFEASNASGIKV